MSSNPSICHMSLADAFLTRMTRDVQRNVGNQKKIESGLGVEVVPVVTDRQTFIENYLQHLYLSKQGIFCKQRSFGSKQQDHFVYDCERSCFSKGASTGDPTKTRANGCRAYISFCFEEGATITVCILRYRLTHFGHNPANREECKVNRIDPTLKANIQEWVLETSQVTEILLKIAKWNKIKSHMDYKDRRFFPSPQDIQQLIWLAQKSKQGTENVYGIPKSSLKRQDVIGLPGLDSLSTILKTKYRDMCTFYQSSSFNGTNSKPMILILQTQHQKEVFRLHGERLIFISKNYEGLRGYGSAIYSLVVKDESDVAFPIAYIISNMDEGYVFIQALHKFESSNSTIHPKVFFIDKDLVNCSDGITTIYPKSKILIPRYQVMKAVHDWLTTSAVAEKSHREVREVLLKYILDLSNCGTEQEFNLGTAELEQKVDYPEFTSMLKNDWLSCGSKWCDFGRSHFFTSTHNSFMVERLFLNLEHQLLKGLQTLFRAEDLVEHIAKDLNHNKSEPDGLIDMEDFLEGTPEEQAENLLQDGWGRLVLWPSTFEALIPSQMNTDQYYSAKLITMECECPFPPYRGLCVHLNLALMLIQKNSKEEGGETVEMARARLAEEAHDNCDFLLERLSVTTFHSGIICVTSLSDFTCTCKASFFGCECVGVLLSRKLHPNTPLACIEPPKQVVEYTVISENPEDASDAETVTAVNSPEQIEIQSDKSSKKLIEDLFLWSQSPQFVDSPTLNSMLLKLFSDNYGVREEKPLKGIQTHRNTHREVPYNSQRRIHAKQSSKESPRKSGRIKTVVHYK